MRHQVTFCIIVILFTATSLARAGSMTTILTPSVRYADSTFSTTLPFVTGPDGSVSGGQPGVYQIDIRFIATPGAGEKGWANTLFDASISGFGGGSAALDLVTGYS